jgi:sugar phosphate isomerase/epimerase
VGVLLEEPDDISYPLETELYILRDHLTGPQGADQEKTSEAAEEEWAQRVRRLSPEARARRADAVSVLLEEPGDISGTLESELHILLGHLKGQAG